MRPPSLFSIDFETSTTKIKRGFSLPFPETRPIKKSFWFQARGMVTFILTANICFQASNSEFQNLLVLLQVIS
jgi:hypothetical protein